MKRHMVRSPPQPDAETSVISPTTIWPSVEPSQERRPAVHPGTPAQVAQSMGPPAAVPERAERAAQVTFEVQAEVIAAGCRAMMMAIGATTISSWRSRGV